MAGSDDPTGLGVPDALSGVHPVEIAHAKERARASIFAGLGNTVRIGRYRIDEKLGAGGMGVVFGAYDGELDRRVAVKLMTASHTSIATARFGREARAMAALSHPNIVQVFEVGNHDTGPYIVMELVEGGSLADRIEQAGAATLMLDLMRQAGEGLAAAHDADLIHRDFKPANVLVGVDGRARVADFGLVSRSKQTDPAAGDTERDAPDAATPQVADDDDQTKTGSVLGTLAYLAPELLDGRDADARSDQFSFCVSLWEAMYGSRPYEASLLRLEQLRRGEARVPPAPPGSGVPTRVRRVLDRGLSIAPDARFVDMHALLHALSPVPTRSRALVWGAVAAGAAFLFAATGDEGTDGACRVSSLAGVWNPVRVVELRLAMARAAPWGERSARSATAAVDAYVSRWNTTAADVCAMEAGDQDTVAAVACLERARLELVAVLDWVLEADARSLADVDLSFNQLSDPSRCGDARAESIPLDPALRADVEDARRSLAALWFEIGREGADVRPELEALSASPAASFPPLALELELALGRLETFEEDHEAAIDRLGSAYDVATELEIPEDAFEAAMLLAHAHLDESDYDEAERWLRRGEALAQRHPRPDAHRRLVVNRAHLLQARNETSAAIEALEGLVTSDLEHSPGRISILTTLARTYQLAARYEDAGRTYETVTTLAIEELGARHPKVGSLLLQHGQSERRRFAHARALELLTEAVDILEDAPPSPRSRRRLARAVGIRTSTLASLGRFDDAVESGERALELAEVNAGAHSLQAADSLVPLATAYDYAGRPDDCRRALLRAQAIYVEELGAEHPNVFVVANHLSQLDASQGRHDEALARLEDTLESRTRIFGPDDPRVAFCRILLGENLVSLERDDEALDQFDAALEIYERDGSAHSIAAADARVGRSGALRRLGRLDEAAAVLRGVLRGLEATGDSEITRAGANLQLALVLDAMDVAPEERRKAATEALAHYERLRGGAEREKIEMLEDVLRRLGPAGAN